jgi:hypothetical protein
MTSWSSANYFPGYVALAQANIRSIEESAYVRRLLLAITEQPDNAPKLNDLRQRIANANRASDKRIAAARQHINEQIGDRLNLTTVPLSARPSYSAFLSCLARKARSHPNALRCVTPMTRRSTRIGSRLERRHAPVSRV